MSTPFRVGISPDFYTDLKGRFEAVIEEHLARVPGIEVHPMPPQPGKRATAEGLKAFDAVLALGLRITAESLEGVHRLAVVARWGVGYDTIDVAALTRAGVALALTPRAVRRPVAEAILTFVFALAKNLMEQDRLVRSGRWRDELSRLGRNLDALVLGSVGCGNIAREMFRLARPLGFRRLLACDPYVRAEEVAELGVQLTTLETVLSESDIVTVNVPLTEETRGMIGEGELRRMKPSAWLINTARGGVVDQEALRRALGERWIAGAGIDVFPSEPPAQDDPLLALDNVILTPHALAWTEELVRDVGTEACANILAVARGEAPPGLLNRPVLDEPGFQAKLARLRAAKRSS
jgi:phosphoglycerate dehydrogenase-like enzyme